MGFVENYVRHAFDFRTDNDAAAATGLLTPRIRGSLSANSTVLKRRALAMPLDEAIKTFEEAGIEVKLKSANPEELRRWVMDNAYRAMRFKELGDWLKAEKLITFVKPGGKVPEGMDALADRRFQVYFRGEQGLVKAGQYYASQPVKLLLDRTISKGFINPLYRGVQGVNALFNSYQLGFSAFHAVETGILSSISDLALSLRQARAGRFLPAAKSAGRSFTLVGSSIAHYLEGDRVYKGILTGDPDALKILRERLNPAGARIAIDNQYRSDLAGQIRQAMANHQYGKVARGVLAAPMEYFAYPLMSQAVPRVKIGAFLDLAAEVKAQRPNASSAALQHAYGLAWDSIDNRLGLLTYDNLFWNRAAVQIGQLMIRSLGWSHGTELELGGGIKDLATMAKDTATSAQRAAQGQGTFNPGKLTDRAAFALALPLYVGVLGTLYQVLHGAGLPSTKSGAAFLNDIFHPQNGQTDANGRRQRVQIKSYMSDAISLTHDFPRGAIQTVEHKIAPLPEFLTAWVNNQNYWGDMVVNPDDPRAKRLQQLGAFALSQFVPMNIEQAMGQSQSGGSMESSVERGFAIQNAPAWTQKSDLETAADKAIGEKLGTRSRTPEEVQLDTLKSNLRQEYQKNGLSSPRGRQMLRALVQAGAFGHDPSRVTANVERFLKTADSE